MKTKTSFILIILLTFSMLAAACSSSANATQSASGTPQANNPPGDDSLSIPTKLAIGTLKLEGTDQAVTGEQAKTLLTLWQAYSALSNSETTANAELDAVTKQIQSAMTPQQTQAIDALQLTRQSMAEAMQSLGIDFGPGAGSVQGTPVAGQSSQRGDSTSGRSTNSGGGFPAGGPDGGGPGGGMPPGGGALPDGGGAGFGAQGTPDATAQARFSNQAARVNPMLLNALIKMLETKAQPSQ